MTKNHLEWEIFVKLWSYKNKKIKLKRGFVELNWMDTVKAPTGVLCVFMDKDKCPADRCSFSFYLRVWGSLKRATERGGERGRNRKREGEDEKDKKRGTESRTDGGDAAARRWRRNKACCHEGHVLRWVQFGCCSCSRLSFDDFDVW